MYDVNTNRIEQVLNHMDNMLILIRQITATEDAEIAGNPLTLAALERAMHLCIEAIADVGNALIDGFIMRDPGSYTDIVEILRDERVIDDQQASRLTEVVAFRKQLINEYTDVPVAELISLARGSAATLEQFAPAVRDFISKELF